MKTLRASVLSVLAVLFFSCNGQTLKNENHSKTDSYQRSPNDRNFPDTLDRPKTNVYVNKRYDDKGRIIQFDSTYSYFYSGPHGVVHLSNDSIFNNFKSFFNKSYPSLIEDQNSNVFFNDSLFKYDFFNDDYFFKRYQLNQKKFEELYKRMDSVKQDFMKHSYPNGYQRKGRAL